MNAGGRASRRFGVDRGKRGYMKRISLTQNKFALVDDIDFDEVSKYKWRALKANRNFYAMRDLKGKHISMHRFIMKPSNNFCVDHKDCDGLNNQRSNLRICSASQNSMNQRKKASASKFKGVWITAGKRRFGASIKVNKKCVYLGCFEKQVDAAIAYDKAANQYFGEFARTNF